MKTLRIAETDFSQIELSEEALNQVAEALPEAVELLLGGKFKNVVAVGRAYKWKKGKALKEACIQVQVVEKVHSQLLSDETLIPSEIGGVITDVIEVGEIEFESLTDRVRPLQIGFSFGAKHEGIKSTGTLGVFATGEFNGQRNYYALSNNHVLANYNTFPTGTLVTQPGPDDGGGNGDIIGSLAAYEELDIHNDNLVDAAMAMVEVDDIPGTRPYVSQVVENITIGMAVLKNGRTTELTAGIIISDMCTTVKRDSHGNTYRMVDQVSASYLSAGGDSGSLVLNRADNKAVGLHWGASNAGVRYSCKMEHVLDALGVTLY
ncbi:S1 family peptidase [Pseudodesulfovibrio sediminis]|uniref:Serine protease n=1 Tax=Pseudodesulfovibrio sediminis TaxID=2810563 RepID=A0ABM7P8P8_9BACT|nr:S1 family peptidase [Pseudodesulfovibrio sediminis]BCS89410.1 hypothetical protein PSDVSF_26520 [Pseudodesulfovibrio sediminis]